jgi:hypothetical protein
MISWLKATKAERIQRWEHVVTVLQALTPHERRKHWNMSVFGEKTDCGTMACAAGYAGLNPWFHKRGFELKFKHVNRKVEEYNFETGEFVEKMVSRYEMVTGSGSGTIGVYVEKFFGQYGSSGIFFDGSPRGVGDVIREVKAYIKELKDA